MTAYDLGLDITIRSEGYSGSVDCPFYLMKVSDETWYRMEGVPLCRQAGLGEERLCSMLGITANYMDVWREDGRLKESVG